MQLDEVIDEFHQALNQFAKGDPEPVKAILACFLDIEHWQAKVGGGDKLSPFDLRVTSIYRLEGDTRALVHRHADPITTTQAPDAGLRK
ncbi:conserved hypothetical protein [Arthrobacter sp. Hiyo4]|nr:conserved hypothetical protein [Arthrobacter sp. Hiyo4]